MYWDKLPTEIHACIWRERFIIMANNTLTNLLRTDEDLPFNANVDEELVRHIQNQLHHYNYFIRDNQLSQLYVFLSHFTHYDTDDSDTSSLSESLNNYSHFVLTEIHANPSF